MKYLFAVLSLFFALGCTLDAPSSDAGTIAPRAASTSFISAGGTLSSQWTTGGPTGPNWTANGSAQESRTAGGAFAITRGATPVASNDYATLAYVLSQVGSGGLGYFVVTSAACGAVGNGVTDDTIAIQTCVNLAQAAGGGVVFFPQPNPTYKISVPIVITSPYVSLIGAEGLGSVYNPAITQYTYGDSIFQANSSHTFLYSLSGQYGPTTTLGASATAGATSLTLASTTGVSVNDWLILDQPNASLQALAPMEQCQVTAIGPPTTIGTCSVQINGISTTQTGLINNHSSGVWVRDQTTISGNSIAGQPPRNYSGLISFTTGDDCGMQNFGVLAMVTGLYFRGIPSANNQNNSSSWVDRGEFQFTQFGSLVQQQTSFKLSNVIYANATEGQITAPGHGLYMTGLIGFSGLWNGGHSYNLYDQAAFGTSLSGTATVTAGSTSISFSTPQTITTSQWMTVSTQSGTAYFLASNCTGCTTATLAQAYNGTSGTGTLLLNEEQYISLASGNVGNEPDISPSFWSAQTFPSASTGWRSLNKDLHVSNFYGSPGANFKDWSGLKIKFTDGAVINGVIIENGVRGFDWEECMNCTATGITMLNFIPPISSDSAAAGMTLLDCNNDVIDVSSMGLTQAALFGAVGAAIDMPVVFDRVDGVQDPITGVPMGHDNTFSHITAITNYDSGFTSQAFRTQALRDRFVENYLNDSGGTNVPMHGFTFNSTPNTWPTGSMAIRPTLVGSTNVLFFSGSAPTNSGFVLDCDPNQLPTGFSFTDQGNGTLLTNCYLTNNEGNLGLKAQSTSADVFDINLPASFSGKFVNTKNSAGNAEWNVSDSSGVKEILESSAANGSGYFCGGQNATGGYPLSGQVIAALAGVTNGGTSGLACGNAGAVAEFTAAENQSSSAFGTDLRLYTEAPGTTTQTKAMRVYGNGNVSMNDTGSALATSATTGFTEIGSMAGIPTGTPTTPTGNTALTYDTADQAFFAAQFDTKALKVVTPTLTGATLACGTFNKLGAGASGNTFTLPDATSNLCKGGVVEIQCTNTAGPFTYNIATTSAQTITTQGKANSSDTCVSPSGVNGTCTYISDGSNWFRENTGGAVNLPLSNLQGAGTAGNFLQANGTNWVSINTIYGEDSPAYHGLAEWNGQPAFAQTNTSLTSGTPTIARITAQTNSTINNLWVNVGTIGTGMTAATTASVTGATSSSGLIDLAFTTTGFVTNDVVSVSGVAGTTEANNCWAITVVDSGHATLQNSAFVNAYVSGGTVTRSANVGVIYSASGALLECTGDQSTTWTGAGAKQMPLAGSMTLTYGSTYYLTVLYNGSNLAFRGFNANAGTGNMNLNGASLRFSTQGSTLTKINCATSATSCTVPASNGTTNIAAFAAALN